MQLMREASSSKHRIASCLALKNGKPGVGVHHNNKCCVTRVVVGVDVSDVLVIVARKVPAHNTLTCVPQQKLSAQVFCTEP